jgi:hypothetical protein
MRMRLAELVTRMRTGNVRIISARKIERNEELQRLTCMWEDNIKVDLKVFYLMF